MELGDVFTVNTPYGDISVIAVHNWCNGLFICVPVSQAMLQLDDTQILANLPYLCAGLRSAGTLNSELCDRIGTRSGYLADEPRRILADCWKLSFGGRITLPEDQLESILDATDDKELNVAEDALRWLLAVDMAYFDNDHDLDKAKAVVTKGMAAEKRRAAKQEEKDKRRRSYRKAASRASHED